MTFIDTVPEEEATGAVEAMYETDREAFGHLPNLTKGFALRPDVYAAWRQLNGAIKAEMDLRRYELAPSPGASAAQAPAARLRALRLRLPRRGLWVNGADPGRSDRAGVDERRRLRRRARGLPRRRGGARRVDVRARSHARRGPSAQRRVAKGGRSGGQALGRADPRGGRRLVRRARRVRRLLRRRLPGVSCTPRAGGRDARRGHHSEVGPLIGHGSVTR